MQPRLAKINTFLLVWALGANTLAAAPPARRTAFADSLFRRGQYPDALRIYEAILQARQSSPAMLLKMAFIEESRGNYAQALYYLNLHFNQRPDERTLLKMEQLAAKYQLTGYQNDDFNYLLVFYEQYFPYVAGLLLVVAAYIFGVILLKRWRREEVPVRHAIALLAYLGLCFGLLNLPGSQAKVITRRDNAYLMSAPSAGAKLLKALPKGNRLNVHSQQDVWLEVDYDQQRAFVRAPNVWRVN